MGLHHKIDHAIKHHIIRHVVHHSKRFAYHLQQHKKHYMIFGGFLSTAFVINLLALALTSFGVINRSGYDLYAQEFSGVVEEMSVLLEGEEEVTTTGEVVTTTEEEVTTTGEVVTTTEEEVTTTGEVVTTTGEVITTTGEVVTTTGEENTFQVLNQESLPVVSCVSGDVVFGNQLSGVVLTGNLSLSWSFSGTACMSGVDLYFVNQLGSGILLSSAVSSTGYVVDRSLFSASTSGYFQFLLSSGDVIARTDVFNIDSIKPYLTGVNFVFSGVVGGAVGFGSPVRLVFTSSEMLSGVSVSLLGAPMSLVSRSGFDYVFAMPLNYQHAAGLVSAKISYFDAVGLTGETLFTGNVFFDKIAPFVSGIVLTGNISSGFDLMFQTSESAVPLVSVIVHNGSGLYTMTGSVSTGHRFLLSGFQFGKIYDVDVFSTDLVGNMTKNSMILAFNYSGQVKYHIVGSNMIYNLYSQQYVSLESGMMLGLVNSGVVSLLTGNELFASLRQELLNFNMCKEDISFDQVTFPLRSYEFSFIMPEFEKKSVRQLVQAFTLLLVKELQSDTLITQEVLNDIGKKFSNFLVVLKLLRDDDASCKQNLSTYYIGQFKQVLYHYGVNF